MGLLKQVNEGSIVKILDVAEDVVVEETTASPTIPESKPMEYVVHSVVRVYPNGRAFVQKSWITFTGMKEYSVKAKKRVDNISNVESGRVDEIEL